MIPCVISAALAALLSANRPAPRAVEVLPPPRLVATVPRVGIPRGEVPREISPLPIVPVKPADEE